jgi:hypothetical protein
MKKFVFVMEWCNHQFFKFFAGKSIDDETLLKEVYEWVRWEADSSIYDTIINDGKDADIEIQYAELSSNIVRATKIRSDIFKKVIEEDEEKKSKAKEFQEIQEKAMLKKLQEKYGKKRLNKSCF